MIETSCSLININDLGVQGTIIMKVRRILNWITYIDAEMGDHPCIVFNTMRVLTLAGTTLNKKH